MVAARSVAQAEPTGGRGSGDGVRDLVVAVTGATGGLGRSIVEALAEAGATVVVGHVPTEADAAEADAIASAAGGVALAVDVADPASCQAFADACADRLGRVDALVNNAGIMEQATIDELDHATWLRVLSVNTTGAFSCVKAFLPLLRQGSRSSIVNMSSQMAYAGGPGAAAYCTSKAALLGLTRALAHDLAPSIRVNAVAPGPIETPMTAAHMSDEYHHLKTHRLVMKRFGQPHEVASAVVYLLGDGASYLTGQTLSPNGGGVMA